MSTKKTIVCFATKTRRLLPGNHNIFGVHNNKQAPYLLSYPDVFCGFFKYSGLNIFPLNIPSFSKDISFVNVNLNGEE